MNLFKTHRFIGKYLFVLLIIVAILPRFMFLNNVPTAINQDELHYALDAKSFFFTGKDVLGQVAPIDILLFNSPQSEPMQAELQYFLGIPFLGIMGFSLVNLILPNALLGIGAVLLIYLIALRIFDRNTAICAGLIAAINPWFIFVSRTIYEAGPATLFFLCVFYILLVVKSWKILLTIPVALLAFYSYIGTKLIFLPFMLASILYAYLFINRKKYLKQYVLLFIFSCLLMFFFISTLTQQGGTARGDELLLPDSPAIIERVNDFRKLTLQNPLLELFENKYTVYGAVLVKNIFNIFSPTYLFANADYFFMMGGHGLFYYVDALFLIVGAIIVFLYRKIIFLLFASFIFIGILPQILHSSSVDGNFTPHIALIIPFLIILMGVGINGLLITQKFKKYSYIFVIGIGIIYLVLFINFCYFYFLKFPLQEGTFETQTRILSKYISLYKNNSQITVFSASPKFAYRQFIFYSNIYNKETADTINRSLREEEFAINNISFLPCDFTGLKDTTTLIISDISCAKKFSGSPISIVQLRDSGRRYDIYNDRICIQHNLLGYISNLRLSDLDLEKLSEKRFCEKFMIYF